MAEHDKAPELDVTWRSSPLDRRRHGECGDRLADVVARGSSAPWSKALTAAPTDAGASAGSELA